MHNALHEPSQPYHNDLQFRDEPMTDAALPIDDDLEIKAKEIINILRQDKPPRQQEIRQHLTRESRGGRATPSDPIINNWRNGNQTTSKENLTNYFNDLYDQDLAADIPGLKEQYLINPSPHSTTHLNFPISVEEYDDALYQLNKKGSLGTYKIEISELTTHKEKILPLLNKCLDNQRTPMIIKLATCTLIHKKGPKDNPANYCSLFHHHPTTIKDNRQSHYTKKIH